MNCCVNYNSTVKRGRGMPQITLVHLPVNATVGVLEQPIHGYHGLRYTQHGNHRLLVETRRRLQLNLLVDLQCLVGCTCT